LPNYNKPDIGLAAIKVLNHNGVQVEFEYPQCCGMPYLEQGNIAEVASRAKKICEYLVKYVDNDYHVISLVPSCSFMIKQEWPNLVPDDEVPKFSPIHFTSEYQKSC
jgi:glycerol-3-phosphate dehydrogenase subunit C